jgi:hypothetical protein
MRITTQIISFEDTQREEIVSIECNICWTPIADYGGWIPITCVPVEQSDLDQWGSVCYFEPPNSKLELVFEKLWLDEDIVYPSRVPLNDYHMPPPNESD